MKTLELKQPNDQRGNIESWKELIILPDSTVEYLAGELRNSLY
jgi:hypothetical protein